MTKSMKSLRKIVSIFATTKKCYGLDLPTRPDGLWRRTTAKNNRYNHSNNVQSKSGVYMMIFEVFAAAYFFCHVFLHHLRSDHYMKVVRGKRT